jgi:pimeloyl-ACP methyl ester carboxylesterase/DNA-binding CsgD family transcriptional regulator
MEQRISFLETNGARVAFSTMGDGPALIFPPGWFSQLDIELESPPLRAFCEAFAEHFTVVRYDRLGTGLSDRDRPPETLTLGTEVEVLGALVDQIAERPCRVFGVSYGACVAATFAAERPDRVDRLVLYGSFGDGTRLASPAVQASMVAMLRANWGLGSRAMTEVFIPDGDPDVARWFIRLQRASVGRELAAAFLEMTYRTDIRPLLTRIVTPTLVLHRRDDRAIPFASGRDVASLIPGARMEALAGRWHQPWLGDTGAVVTLALEFLGVTPDPKSHGSSAPVTSTKTLTTREREILSLVADGLSDAEIANRLVLSPHTVHRHVANIRTRLGQPSRAAAAAYATRLNMI